MISQVFIKLILHSFIGDCSSIGKKEGKLRVGGKSDANKSAITPS
jgi:hypothetical protein